MTYTSAKAFFAAANGKRVRKVVTGVATAEQWPDIVADIRAQLLAQGAAESDIEETPEQIAIGSQFWRAPKMRGDEFGVLTVRSSDYGFTPEDGRTNGKPIMGDKAGCKVEGAALVKRYPNGMQVTFTIEADA